MDGNRDGGVITNRIFSPMIAFFSPLIILPMAWCVLLTFLFYCF